jgi:hypothetical protein
MMADRTIFGIRVLILDLCYLLCCFGCVARVSGALTPDGGKISNPSAEMLLDKPADPACESCAGRRLHRSGRFICQLEVNAAFQTQNATDKKDNKTFSHKRFAVS